MKLQAHINLIGICPELLVGLMAVEHVYHEFGEELEVDLAGKKYIKCNLPRDEVVASSMCHVLQDRLTSQFNVDMDEKYINVDFLA
jgi:hypothetical protein